MTELTLPTLRDHITYDSDTGQLRWTKSRGTRARAGARAGYMRADGYVLVGIGGKRYLAHRLVWFLAHGEWPEGDLDHIDRNPSNNRLSNLRQADKSQNQANRGLQANNTSGFKGVSFHKKTRLWQARVGRGKHCGLFSTPEEAHAAYVAGAREVFGPFARAS